MQKILTITIPTYNMEKYLDKCLKSFIYDEKTNDIEVLIVNDGSKDNSLIIAKNYEEKYPNIFKVIDKENGGHGSTINVGIKYATGKYFKVVDADDWVETENLKLIIEHLKQTKMDLVLTNYVEFYEHKNKYIIKRNKDFKPNCIYNTSDIFPKHFIVMHSIIYKTELIKDMKLQEHCFYVDNEYNIYGYNKCTNLEYVDLNIYYYRLGRSGQSVSIDGLYKHRENHYTVLSNLLRFYSRLANNNAQKEYTKKSILFMIHCHYSNFSMVYLKYSNIKDDLIKFDTYLKENFTYFYDLSNKHSPINFIKNLRKKNFKNLKFFGKLIAFAYKLAGH